MHKDNMRKLTIGFRSLLIVPTIFLALLFFTGSSKTVFLILWIVSMFIIAFYLVRIEYSDYQLQGRINKATDREGEEVTSLMRESIESNRNAMHDLLMREDIRLPFKLGIENRMDNSGEAEYDTGNEPVHAGTADGEPFGNVDAFPHEDADGDHAAVSGLSEDDDFLSEAESYGMEEFEAEFGGGPASEADSTPVTVPARETAPVGPRADSGEKPPEPESEPEFSGDAGISKDTGAELESESARQAAEVDMIIESDGLFELGILDDGDASGLGGDELPGGITVDDILSEFHKNQRDADDETDYSDCGDIDFSELDTPDIFGEISGDSNKDGEL